jgi:hypothetical protein
METPAGRKIGTAGGSGVEDPGRYWLTSSGAATLP